MAKNLFKLALVGRPNVGKSTLFNRLCKKKIALVDDFPGMTRDRREQNIEVVGYPVCLMDMAGWEETEKHPTETLQDKMNQQVDVGIQQADLILFVLDGRAGLLPHDEQLAKKIIQTSVPFLPLVNKVEQPDAAPLLTDFARLGFEDLLPISAEHGIGIDLLQIILSEKLDEYYGEDDQPEMGEKSIKLVLMGRPNVGKSTLINRLLCDDRVIVNDAAGTTRDALAFDWQWGEDLFTLYDTAGLRRAAKIDEPIEKTITADSLKAVRFAHIVAIVVDAEQPLERQELRLIRHASDEGRAVMILLNKWDKIKQKHATLQKVQEIVADTLPMIRYVPIITLSAIKDKDFDVIPEAALQLYELWNRKISTPKLNDWLAEKLTVHSPPLVSGRRLKIRYITQIRTRPPQIHLFASMPIPTDYLRYLSGALRDDFKWYGVPLRLVARRGTNPYADKKKPRVKSARKAAKRMVKKTDKRPNKDVGRSAGKAIAKNSTKNTVKKTPKR